MCRVSSNLGSSTQDLGWGAVAADDEQSGDEYHNESNNYLVQSVHDAVDSFCDDDDDTNCS